MDEQELSRLRLLEWVYNQAKARLDQIIALSDYPHAVAGEDALMCDVFALVGEGLLTSIRGLTLHVQLTNAGRREVERVCGLRGERVAINKASRDALVCWLYDSDATTPDDQVPVEAFSGTPYGWWWGQPFPARQVTLALQFLEAKKLVDGVHTEEQGLVLAYLTTDGVDCAESGLTVQEYLVARDRAGNVHQSITVTNSQGAAIALNSAGAQQSTNFTQVQVAKALYFADVVEQSLPTLDLDADQEQDARTLVEQIREHAKAAGPDMSVLRRLVASLTRMFEGGVGGALGDLLTAMGGETMKAIGL